MRTAYLAPTLGLTLLLAAASAGAQTPSAPPVAATATPWQMAEPPAPPPQRPEPDDAAAQDVASARAVERLLATLDADARERRVLGLSVGLGGGAVVTGIGAWMMTRDESSRLWENPGWYIGASGVGLMLGGVLNAVLPAYLHELNDSWRETAGRPIAVRRAHFGVVLDELAERARSARLFAGRFSLGVGAAVVVTAAILYGVRETPSSLVTSPEMIAGVAGALFMATSIPALTTRSPIEHAAMFWHAGDARPSVRLTGLSMLPTRGGALASVALTF